MDHSGYGCHEQAGAKGEDERRHNYQVARNALCRTHKYGDEAAERQ
jgi:hypothetical protein